MAAVGCWSFLVATKGRSSSTGAVPLRGCVAGPSGPGQRMDRARWALPSVSPPAPVIGSLCLQKILPVVAGGPARGQMPPLDQRDHCLQRQLASVLFGGRRRCLDLFFCLLLLFFCCFSEDYYGRHHWVSSQHSAEPLRGATAGTSLGAAELPAFTLLSLFLRRAACSSVKQRARFFFHLLLRSASSSASWRIGSDCLCYEVA